MPHGSTDPKASQAAEVDPMETKEETSEASKFADQEVNAVGQTKDTTSGRDRESPTTLAPAEANGVQTPEQLAELLATDKYDARNVISWRVPHSPPPSGEFQFLHCSMSIMAPKRVLKALSRSALVTRTLRLR